MSKSDEDGRPAVILLVENAGLLRVLTGVDLADAGYRVLEAADAEEALAILKACSDVRLLITDLALPDALDGLALAHRVRAGWPHMGIIILSSRGPLGSRDVPSGTRFLEQPLFPFVLMHEVRKLLNGSRSGGQPETGSQPLLEYDEA